MVWTCLQNRPLVTWTLVRTILTLVAQTIVLFIYPPTYKIFLSVTMCNFLGVGVQWLWRDSKHNPQLECFEVIYKWQLSSKLLNLSQLSSSLPSFGALLAAYLDYGLGPIGQTIFWFMFVMEIMTPNIILAAKQFNHQQLFLAARFVLYRWDITCTYFVVNSLNIYLSPLLVPYYLRKEKCPELGTVLTKQKYLGKLLLVSFKSALLFAISFLLMTTWRPYSCEKMNGSPAPPCTRVPNFFNSSYYIGIIVCSTAAWSIQLFCYLYYDGYDPLVDVIGVVLSYSMDANKIGIILHPGACAVACLNTFVIILSWVIVAVSHGTNSGEILFGLIVTGAEIFWPILTLVIIELQLSRSVISVIIALFSLDYFLMHSLVLLVQIILSPLSLLSFISIWKGSLGITDKDVTKNDTLLLSYAVRDNWASHNNSQDSQLIGSALCQRLWIYTKHLSSRFTVVYSFIKLVGTLVIAFCFGNYGYWYCNDKSYHKYYLQSADFSCSAGQCHTHCTQNNKYYPAYSYISNDQCVGQLPGYCMCGNWLNYQLPLIIMNILHFVVQCYFFIRYDSFDPQQNQIDCVQSYAFAGDNLALFLTKPSICFLSTLEAMILVVVWAQYAARPGVSCSNNVYSYSLADAVYMTVMEVYKANMSVASSQFMTDIAWLPVTPASVGWAAWSLVRVDLFIFYGLTLFLQTFLYPFSLAAYLATRLTSAVIAGGAVIINNHNEASNDQHAVVNILSEGNNIDDDKSRNNNDNFDFDDAMGDGRLHGKSTVEMFSKSFLVTEDDTTDILDEKESKS